MCLGLIPSSLKEFEVRLSLVAEMPRSVHLMESQRPQILFLSHLIPPSPILSGVCLVCELVFSHTPCLDGGIKLNARVVVCKVWLGVEREGENRERGMEWFLLQGWEKYLEAYDIIPFILNMLEMKINLLGKWESTLQWYFPGFKGLCRLKS